MAKQIRLTTAAIVLLMACFNVWAQPLCGNGSPVELLPCTDVSNERFGYSVSIDGDHAVVGAIFADNGASQNAGAAYMFSRSNGSWSHTASLAPEIVQQNTNFGWSSSVSGDFAAVGAPGTQSMLGYTYLFATGPAGWAQVAQLSSPAPGSGFGRSVVVQSGTVIVGAPISNSVHIFKNSPFGWIEVQTLQGSVAGSQFGAVVDFDGNTLVVSAPYAQSGVVYVFNQNGSGVFVLSDELANTASNSSNFGHAVSVSSNNLGISSPSFGTSGSVSQVTFYEYDGAIWNIVRTVDSVASDLPGIDFGWSIDIENDIAIVSSPSDFATYAYIKENGNWKLGALVDTPEFKINPVELQGSEFIIGQGRGDKASVKPFQIIDEIDSNQEWDTIDNALFQRLDDLAEHANTENVWIENSNQNSFVASEIPVYLLRKENSITKGYLLNWPYKPEGAVLVNHNLTSLGTVYRYDIELDEFVSAGTFEFDLVVDGRSTYAHVYGSDLFGLNNPAAELSWVRLFFHELFHHYQFHSDTPAFTPVGGRYGLLTYSEYPFSPENISWVLLERYALIAGMESSVSADKIRYLKTVAAIREYRSFLDESDIGGLNAIHEADATMERSEGSAAYTELQMEKSLFFVDEGAGYLHQSVDLSLHFTSAGFRQNFLQGYWYWTGAWILELLQQVGVQDFQSQIADGATGVNVIDNQYAVGTAEKVSLIEQAGAEFNWLQIAADVCGLAPGYIDESIGLPGWCNDNDSDGYPDGAALGLASLNRCNGFPVTVDLNAGDAPTIGDDVILGTAGADVIAALAGNDTICGKGGDDTINAGPGDDWVSAGAGNDRVFGLDGADILSGGIGNDEIVSGAGEDLINGDEGNDVLNGGPDDDMVYGGMGDDNIFGQSGDDQLYGGDGNDFIIGVDGADVINGGAGSDTLNGGPGNDFVNGDDGADIVFGLSGDDTLDGGLGDDQVFGQIGSDTITGGGGDDRLFGNEGDDDIAAISGTNTINGGAGNDTITGGSGNDDIFGDGDVLQAGDDVIDGGGGADLLIGFAGNDTITADDGIADTVNGGPGTDVCTTDATDTVFNCP